MLSKDYNKYFLILAFINLILFFFGFSFDENSSGGSKSDFFLHDLNVVNLFKDLSILEAIKSDNYDSSRTPLFFIITKYISYIDDPISQRIFTFWLSLLTSFIFYIGLINKYSNTDRTKLICLSTIILIVPTFRGPAFWGQPENLAIFFTILSFAIYYSNSLSNNLKLNFSIFVSYLAFYSDQKYLIIPIIFLLINLNYSKIISYKNVNLILINFFCILPFLYLIYLWGSFFPQPVNELYANDGFSIKINIENLSKIISIFFITFFPIIIIYRKRILENLNKLNKLDKIIIFIFILIFIFFAPDLNYNLGGGLIFKFFYYINNYLFLDLFTKSFQIVLIIVIFIILYSLLKNKLSNLLPLLFFGCLSLVMPNVFREYIDPLNFILICFFYQFFNTKNLVDGRLILYFEIYYIGLLVISITYYHFFLKI